MKALIDIARKKQGSYSVAKVVWEITLNTKIIFFFNGGTFQRLLYDKVRDKPLEAALVCSFPTT